MGLVSLVRMGAARGVFPLNMEKINELIVSMQPATINAANGQNLTAAKRDAIRAEEVRAAMISQGDDSV
jgi:protein-arginine kinase